MVVSTMLDTLSEPALWIMIVAAMTVGCALAMTRRGRCMVLGHMWQCHSVIEIFGIRELDVRCPRCRTSRRRMDIVDHELYERHVIAVCTNNQ